MYERPEVAPTRRTPSATAGRAAADVGPTIPVLPPDAVRRPAGHDQSGVPFVVAGAALLAATVAGTRLFGNESLGVVLIPAAGLAVAAGFGRRCMRLRPHEPWLPRLLLIGTVVKLLGSYARYFTLTNSYDGGGDATRYDIDGRRFVAAWTGLRPTAPELSDLHSTNFMKWITGIVYYLFGQNLLAAFFLFSLLALIGSYFWYRALNGTQYADKRLFLVFMMFAPSIVFWPASLGKEALMQLGIGALAWATAILLGGRLLAALPALAGGGWLLWIIRPHLLALVAIAGAVPYLLARVGRAKGSVLGRPIGLVIVGALVVVSVAAGARYLGLENLSLTSLQDQLDEQTALTSKGGSSFSHGSNSLSPLTLPQGVVTVLFRPLPWEARNAFQALAALESAVLIGLIVRRFGSVALAFRRSRKDPILLYSIVLLLLYSLTFSAFANFGLLTRQRSLVLPALYILISLDVSLVREGVRDRDLRRLARTGG